MKVVYRRRFLKDLAAIPSAYRARIEEFVFEELPRATSVREAGRLEPLKAHRGFFKARFGVYRLGGRFEADTVILARALHRKDMYRKFP